MDTEFQLGGDFPPVDYDQWRKLVEKDLKGAPFEKKLVTQTFEGVQQQPIYTSGDWPSASDPAGFPGMPYFLRGATPLGAARSGWDLRQEYAHPDIEASSAAILADLEGGATSLLVRFDRAVRRGADADNSQAEGLAAFDGVAAYHVDDLDRLLKDVQLPLVGVALDAGAAFLPAAAQLVALWERRGTPWTEARGSFNSDPLAALASDGYLPMSATTAFEQLADLAAWTADNFPLVTAVQASTAPYHHAGATAVQDIAFGIATAIEYLRGMTDGGLSIDSAARQIEFSMCVGTHQFLSIAKLRAMRSVWARVIEACGGTDDAKAMRLHARVSRRVLTSRDPYVNLLRNTVAVFAAGIGGANSITSVPFDAALGLPDVSSRRIARNTLHVLQDEAHLNRVVDPAGGSWFMDSLAHELANEAWDLLQKVEQQGGMLAVLESGWVAEQIQSAFAPRAKSIATRKQGITGVSEFPNIAEEPLVRTGIDRDAIREQASRRLATARCGDEVLHAVETSTQRTAAAVEAAIAGASIGQLSRSLGLGHGETTATRLAPRPFAAPYEELRDASDAWYAKHQARPKAFLANMGPVAHHTARATFAKNFFEAGGFEVVSNDGFADANTAVASFVESGANIAVVCSSDKLYPEFVPEVAGRLKDAGATTVVLAGNPGPNEEAWRAAGVDRFIFIKCDVLATLRELLREEGVLES